MLLKCGAKNKLVKKRIWLDGTAFWMLMLLNPKADAEEAILIFLTTLPPTEKTARMYAKRWKIKCLFLHLKTNGYNLEDLNLKDPNKNRLMLAIVTIAYILSVREGWKRGGGLLCNVTATEPKRQRCLFFGKDWPF